MGRLIHLPVSPWSEKARWALDHHRIERQDVEYVPMLGEPWLRARLGRWSGRVTVPVWIDGPTVLDDSWDIARDADRRGRGTPLFAEGHEQEIRAWNERSEALLGAGRALVVERMADDRGARRESLPPFLPAKSLGAVLDPVARTGVRFFIRKYELRGRSPASCLAEMRTQLEALREALVDPRGPAGEASPERHLLPEVGFSYADVAMGAALQCVHPVDDERFPLGPATRRCWSHEELREEFADLLAWRDTIYVRHR